jgi:hypothetical protein
MFHPYDKLKRAIGLLGVVLALSSSFQKTHLFCYLADCTPTFSSVVAEGHDCSDHDCSDHGCPYSKANRKSHTATVMPTHDECAYDLCGSRPGPCPCPPACWCHQAPEPFELPRSAPEPTELLVVGTVYLDVTIVGSLHGEHLSRCATIAALDSSVKSSAQVCVQLCRFLT